MNRRVSERSMFRWSDTVIESVAAIVQRPARTLLTALGTLLGVGAFVTTIGLAATVSAQVSSRFNAIAATEVRVQDVLKEGTNPFPADVDQRLMSLNGVESAGLFFTVTGDQLQPRSTVARSTDAMAQDIPVMGATPGALLATLPSLATGRLYDDFHQQRAEKVAVLGSTAAKELGINRVDHWPVVFIADTAYTVIGIIDNVKRNTGLLTTIIIPTTTAESNLPGSEGNFEVLIDSQVGAAKLVGRQAPLALRPDQPGRLRSLVPPDPKELRRNIESDVTSLYYALSGLALLVGTIAIANATLLSTIERRSEVGLRRALGATRFHIIRQITVEAAATGSLAGIGGTSVGVIAISVVAQARGWTAVVSPAIVATAPLIGLATGAVAGIVPALRAAQIPPATALRS